MPQASLPPQPAVRTGAFVARWVKPVAADQIQPNGVDLRAHRLFRVVGAGRLAATGTSLGERQEVPWSNDHAAGTGAAGATGAATNTTDADPLPPGAYVVRYREELTIPSGHVGQVFPRSSLLRNGAMLFSALWDQGYRGRGEGLLVLWQPLYLPAGARIGQLVLWTAERADGYSGQYQAENL